MPRYLATVAILLLLGVSSARAEVLVTGFGGVAFGGATEKSRGTFGGAIGFLGAGVVGFEVEGAATPDFFGSAGEGVFTENNVSTLMGNILLAAPAGPVRIYGTAGGGLLKTRLEDPDRLFSIDRNSFGINVGGGLIVFLGNHVGLRGDVRYFRDLQDPDPDGELDLDFGNVDYWRGVGGITLRF